MNHNEIFNEFIVLLCCYHLHLFTDFLDSAETKYRFGWSIISIVVLSLVINFGKIFIETIKEIKNKFPKVITKLKLLS
jgi:hypothetical protein